MSGPRIGALCAGYGGLDMAVQDVLGGELAWVAENDPAASKVLAHRFPGVPNLGDITRIDWATVPPVDLVTAGFPCTDVSVAGLGLGIAPGTRSGLWLHIARGLAVLRPPLVVIENVRGLLSAKADRGDAPDPDLDPLLRELLETADAEATTDPGRGHLGSEDEDLGDLDDTGPVLLRALGAVLGDLADIGFDAEWTSLRAADVGACHGRRRIGVLARPTAGDTYGGGRDRWPAAGLAGQAGPEVGPATHADIPGLEGSEPAQGRDVPARGVAAHAEGDGWDEGRPEPARVVGRPDAAERSADAPADSYSERPVRDRAARGRGAGPADDRQPAGIDWGAYAVAVQRWELSLGRPAPAPTEPSRNGGRRLSPRFVEWMQGCPEGWVTDVQGISRNDMLRILGNGVVWQQFSAVIRILLARTGWAPAGYRSALVEAITGETL